MQAKPRLRRTLAAAFVIFTAGQPAAAGDTLSQRDRAAHAGVYVTSPPLVNARRAMPDEAFRQDAASGVYIRLVWSSIEPQRGVYDFALLRNELERAVAGGKKISLSVIAGSRAPEWLEAAGVKVGRFAIGRGGANRECLKVTIGLPWDKAYQEAFIRLWRAIAAEVRKTPGALEALRIVKLTGVNQSTEELRQPGTFGKREDVCGVTDDAEIWRGLGYRPQLVVDGWTAMATGIAAEFPGKLLALDILERNDFPPIGDDGAFDRDPPVKDRIIAAGRKLFDTRFAVQWNGLTAEGPLAGTVSDAARDGVIIGWQSNAFRGVEGAGCNTRRQAAPESCDAPSYGAILDRGVTTGADYLEIWSPDVAAFPDAVRKADRALVEAAKGRR